MACHTTGVCQLCQGRTLASITIRDKIFWHCQVCDLVFLDEAFRLNWEQERERYLLHDNTLANQGYVRFLTDFMEKAVLPYSNPGQKVLDYGCGPGPVLQTLLEREGFMADVYDPFFAPEKPGPDQKYDLITCTEVLEHVYRPLEVWDDIVNLLRPGGYLSATTLFHPPGEEFAHWWYIRDETHVCFYSRETFFWIAANLPLELVAQDGVKTVIFRRKG